MTDRAAQLRTLATSFYREMMRLADEMDAGGRCTCGHFFSESHNRTFRNSVADPACPRHGVSAMDPALDC